MENICSNWIIVDTITSNIKRIPSRHILIIADSCYSGTFTRRAVAELVSDQERGRYLSKMKAKRSRTLLASGGNEPVSDIGGKGHSVFAKAFYGDWPVWTTVNLLPRNSIINISERWSRAVQSKHLNITSFETPAMKVVTLFLEEKINIINHICIWGKWKSTK